MVYGVITWDFGILKSGQTWQTFAMFSQFDLKLPKCGLCLVHTGVTVAMRTEFFKIAGDFGLVFVGGKAEYFK